MIIGGFRGFSKRMHDMKAKKNQNEALRLDIFSLTTSTNFKFQSCYILTTNSKRIGRMVQVVYYLKSDYQKHTGCVWKVMPVLVVSWA